jgi:hypothetical protein
VRFRKINRTPRIRSDLAVTGVSRPLTMSSVIVGRTAPLFRVFSTAVLCLALTGSADAAGPVVGWGGGEPPDTVNGVSGAATSIASGYDQSCAIQAGTGNVVCEGQATPPIQSMAFRGLRSRSRRAAFTVAQLRSRSQAC